MQTIKSAYIPGVPEPAGLFFEADWSRYAATRRPALVLRAAEVVLDLGEKLVLRLSRPIPGDEVSARDGIARVLCDRGQFLDLGNLGRTAAPTAASALLAGKTVGGVPAKTEATP